MVFVGCAMCVGVDPTLNDKLLDVRAERGVVVSTPTAVKVLFRQALECCQLLLPGQLQPVGLLFFSCSFEFESG